MRTGIPVGSRRKKPLLYPSYHFGTGWYEVNGTVIQLSAGDTFILYPDTEVRYYADSQNPWEYAWVGFMGEDADTIIRATDFRRKHPWIKKVRFPII